MSRILTIYFLFLLTGYCFGQNSRNLETVIQKGHAEAVKSIALSPDGNYLLSASRDKSIILWEYKTGYQIRSFLGHESTVTSLSYNRNGKQFASGSTDKTVRLWDTETGAEIRKWTVKDYVTDVAISPKGNVMAVGGYDWVVTIFDLVSGDTIKTIKCAPDKGMGYGVEVEFSPDGTLLALGEDNRTARVFNTKEWQEIYRFRPEHGSCGGCGTIVKFNPSGNRLLKASNNGPAALYDLNSGEELAVFVQEADDVSGLGISKDVVVFSDEFSVRTFDLNGLSIKDSLGGFESQLNDVILDDEGRILLAADNKVVTRLDNNLQVTDTYSGILHLDDSSRMPYDLSSYWERYIALYLKYLPTTGIDAEGEQLTRYRTGKYARVWSLENNQIIRDFDSGGGVITAMTYDNKNSRAVIGTTQGNLFLWNLNDNKPLFKIKDHREPIFDVVFSNDERLFASCSWDGLILVYNAETGERVHRIDLGNVSAYDIAFTENDAYLIVSKLDKKLELFELNTGRSVREFVGHTAIVSEIKLGSEGYFFTSSWDGSVIRWNITSELIDTQYRHETGAVYDIAILENQLISVGADRDIYVWDISLGSEPQKRLKTHTAEVTGISVVNNRMISSDVDGVVKIWEFEKLQELYEHIQIGPSDWMIRTPDGYFTGTEGAMVNIHFVDGMKSYAADQFFEQFYNPDLLKQERGVNNKQGSLKGAIEQFPPLETRIGGLKTAGGTKADLLVQLETKKVKLKELKVYHNGKRIVFDSKPRFKNNVFQFDVELVAGANEFKVIATNVGDIDSAPSVWKCYSETAKPASTCHILSIGINEYRNKNLNLNYARSDASAFSQDLELLTSDLFQEVRVREIFDTDANRQNIEDAITEMASDITLNDVFILYYAGHGSFINNEFYLVPTEAKRLYDVQELQEQALSATELQRLLSEVKALKQLIIMDACQSGASVELLARRGALEEKAMAQLSRSSGIHVMASAGSEQFATEFSQIGHGLFTYVLLEAIGGKADGAPKDGKVTIFELKSYLDAKVPEKSAELKGSPQYPYTFSRGNDFPLVLVR